MAFAATLSSSPISFPNTKNSRLSPNAPLPNLKFSSRTKTLALPEASAAGAAAASFDGTAIAVLGGGSIAALAVILSLSDPNKRRRLQAEEVGGDDKQVVKDYFNNSGFQRWKKIYGDTDDVNRVQLDIRIGHAKTVENALKMLKEDCPLRGVFVCDAGCGTSKSLCLCYSPLSLPPLRCPDRAAGPRPAVAGGGKTASWAGSDR